MFTKHKLERYHDSFVYYKEADMLIDQIDQLNDDDSFVTINQVEHITEKMGQILDNFQEQPHLIDPKIAQMFKKLFAYIYQKSNVPSVKYHTSFKFIYHITKVRGYKAIIKYLPHEASDLPLVLELLTQEFSDDVNTWKTRYILLIWLSLLVTLPFNFQKYDSKSETPLMEK